MYNSHVEVVVTYSYIWKSSPWFISNRLSVHTLSTHSFTEHFGILFILELNCKGYGRRVRMMHRVHMMLPICCITRVYVVVNKSKQLS